MTLDKFKQLIYFEKYKNYPISARDKFRNYFSSTHGRYKDLDELIRMIETYQINTYGCTLQCAMDHTNERRCR